jgi:hypothetical protein
MRAQLRDVFAAEDSSVVPQKYDHCGLAGPKRAELRLLPVAVGERDPR